MKETMKNLAVNIIDAECKVAEVINAPKIKMTNKAYEIIENNEVLSKAFSKSANFIVGGFLGIYDALRD